MPQHENQGKLERGRIRVELLRELALGATNRNALAKRFQVSDVAIRMFMERHEEEITTLREDLENEWAGLWIANKRDRLAELQQAYEDCQEQVQRQIAGGGLDNLTGVPLMKLSTTILHQAAEELGQIVQKPNAGQFGQEPPVITYELGGAFDPAALT